MRIQRYISNPRVLLKKIKEQLDLDVTISTTTDFVEFHDLPSEVEKVISTFVNEWSESKTDEEELLEEQVVSDEIQILRKLYKALRPEAFKPMALEKIQAILNEENKT